MAICGGYSGYGNPFALYRADLVVDEIMFGKPSPWADLLGPERHLADVSVNDARPLARSIAV